MLIGLCSLKSSPGVTTATLALAGCWPLDSPAPTVIELDARGGDVAWRFGLGTDPGLRSLAAAARLKPEADLLADHAALVGSARVAVVVAPPERAPARHAVDALAPLLDVLREKPTPVLLDLGEVDPQDSATQRLLGGLAQLVVVARPVPEQISRLQAAAPLLHSLNPEAVALLVGDIDEREVAGLLDLPTIGALPVICAEASGARRLFGWQSRRRFGAATVAVARKLADRCSSLESESSSARVAEVPA